MDHAKEKEDVKRCETFAFKYYMNRAADHCLWIVFCLYFRIRKFKPLIIFYGCTARFVSDLLGNSEDRFSHVVANNNVFEF